MDNKSGGLWGGRFKEGLARPMEALNRSLDVDWRLMPFDIAGSQSWARALAKAGVLTEVEADEIVAGLERVRLRLSDGTGPTDFPDEDIHSLVERLLTEDVGPLGGKLHTGRSRNDQVATDFRMWSMAALGELEVELSRLIEALVEQARSWGELAMPAYTHLQRAQPTSAAHWLLSRAWPFVRDLDQLRGLRADCGSLPLGSGAVAGCAFPVDRTWLAQELGFAGPSENSTDSVSDRDWAARLLFSGAMLGVHISQLAEDLVLFSSQEFGFVRLADSYTTGSSLMPQKKNPDVAELARGKSGRLVGNLVRMLTVLKGLPTGYNRDLQEDKEGVFDTVDTLRLVLPAVSGAIETMSFDEQRTRAALGTELLATDLADYLVNRGVPFRESHHVIGQLVQLAEGSSRALDQLELAELKAVNPVFSGDVAQVFDFSRSLESRSVIGGTGRTPLNSQLSAISAKLTPSAQSHSACS